MSDSVVMMSEADVAELKRYRARARRNAAARARRVPGADYRVRNVRTAAYAPTYAAAGTVSLADLDYVAKIHANVLAAAVIRLVEDDSYSWTRIGAELGISRQAAVKRYGELVKGRQRGGQPGELR